MNGSRSDIIIIGAGIIGLASAFELACDGAAVRVLERHLPGAGQSTRTGGGIRLSHGSQINVELTRLSLALWQRFETVFDVDCHWRETGHLFVTSDPEKQADLQTQSLWHRQAQVPTEILTSEDIQNRWPHLGALKAGCGSYCAIGGYLDQHRVIQGYQRGVLAKGGIIDCGTRVDALRMENNRVVGVSTAQCEHTADVVINAAGPDAGRISGFAGIAIPFVSRRHELLIVRSGRAVPDGTPWLIDLDAQVHLRPDGQGRALIGGFLGKDEAADSEHYAREFSQDWADRVRAAAATSFGLTEADCRIVEGWAGLYPGTADYLPVVEETVPGLITSAGFSGTGLMHAPAIGRIVADLARGQAPQGIDLSALRSSRFDGARTVAEATGF